MAINFSLAELQQMFPVTPRDKLIPLVPHLVSYCNKYGIDNTIRFTAFIAQVGHESAGLTALRENLNYSKEGLVKVFPRYFDVDTATLYEHKSEKIANRVYANRMGNGDEQSGDGFKFCGRGLLQLTGKDNYASFAKWCGKTLDEAVAFLGTPEGAVASAVYFWVKNGLNVLADKGDFETLTKRINGGTNGLSERLKLYNKAKTIFK